MAGGRLVKAAKQKQGNRKRQQSRMTKQPRRRFAVGRTRNENNNNKGSNNNNKGRHKINNKTEGKTTKQVRKEPNSLGSTRLNCVFKSEPFPYYLAYSYIKCSHKTAANNNNNNGVGL